MFPSALMTDLYELTMLAGYHRQGIWRKPACFELFFRDLPFQGGYAVFAGLQPALHYLEQLQFTAHDLEYLTSLKLFQPEFIEELKTFRFRGRVDAPAEGTPVFADEPLLTVTGTLAETQLVESALLNIINFQTLIATKAARIQQAAGEATVVEFGLRRAQGPDGALSVARAACIGGVRSTSNTWAGQVFGLPVKGTHAHSWVMAFDHELEAFRAYAESFADSAILLVDTYDSLRSGIPHALQVAQELRDKGHELRGIRLDSGNLAKLSQKARRIFDRAGFPRVKIVASSDLDEHAIAAIREAGGKVDIYGVGTNLATAGGPGGGALGGVYKLVSIDGRPCLKTTSDPHKATLPGKKQLLRLHDTQDNLLEDIICTEDEHLRTGEPVCDLSRPQESRILPEGTLRSVLQPVMNGGRIVTELPSLAQSADVCAAQLQRLPPEVSRLKHPQRYQVSISGALHHLREQLVAARTEGGAHPDSGSNSNGAEAP